MLICQRVIFSLMMPHESMFFFRVCVCGVASLKEWNNVEIFHDPTQEQFVQ